MPSDGGPIYQETLQSDHSFLIEPWNAISSIAIILPAIYWAFIIKNKPFKDFLFMWYCIPLLILGGSGSTLFHGFRNSSWLLYLDVVPTAILTLSVGVLFWHRVVKKWVSTSVIFIISVLIRYFISTWLSGHEAANLIYFVTGVFIFLPIVIYLKKIHWLGLKTIILSVLFLILSLIFREIDQRGIFNLPMGTHFLWHLSSGVGAFYLAKFLYLLRIFELNRLKLSDAK